MTDRYLRLEPREDSMESAGAVAGTYRRQQAQWMPIDHQEAMFAEGFETISA